MGVATRNQEGEGLSESVPFLGYLGAACWAMWVLLMYGGGLLSITVESATLLAQSYVLSTIGVAVASCLIGLAGSRSLVFLGSFRAMGVAAAIASVGTAAVIAGGSSGSALLLYGGNALTGLGTGCIAMRCALQFAALPPRTSNIIAALMMACALVAAALFETLDDGLLAAVMVALPLCAAAFSFLVPRGDATEAAPARSGDLLKGVAAVFAMMLLVLLVFLMSGIVPFALSYEVFSIRSTTCVLLGLCFCAVVVVVAALLPDRFPFNGLYAGVLVVILGFYLVVLAMGAHIDEIAIFFTIASIMLNVIVWSFLASVAHVCGPLGPSVFAFGRAFVAAGATLSWFIGSFRLVGGDALFAAVVIAEAVALVAGIAAIVIAARKRGGRMPVLDDFDSLLAPSRQGDDGEGAAAPEEAADVMGADKETVVLPSRWRIRMMLLVEKYGLTPREADVFMVLAKGRDAQAIADELTVSLSTVRTHVRGIYAKLGVHSRREFQQLVDEEARAIPLGDVEDSAGV